MVKQTPTSEENGAGTMPAVVPSAPSPVSVNVNFNEKGPRAPQAPPPAPPQPPTPQASADDDDDDYFDEDLDPVAEFEDRFNDGRRYNFNLTRLQDPPHLDNYFLKPCLEDMSYPRMPYRYGSLILDIQRKLRSGGRVRVQMYDDRSNYIRGGSLTFNVPDPDELSAPPPAEHSTEPQKSEAERRGPDFMQRLTERLFDKTIERMESDMSGRPEKDEAKTQLSPEDELTLTLTRHTDLLPRIVERLSKSISNGDESARRPRGFGERVLDTMESSPVLQHKAGRAFERVLNRFFPDDGAGGGDDDSDDEGDESKEERQKVLMDFFFTCCAEDTQITFAEEIVTAFAESDPDDYAELLDSLAGTPTALIKAYFSGLSPLYAAVLKLEHADQWITNLKASAAAERKRLNEK